jgi:hypothetical protein
MEQQISFLVLVNINFMYQPFELVTENNAHIP